MDIVKFLDNSPTLAHAFFEIAKEIPNSTVYSQALLNQPNSGIAAEKQTRTWISPTYAEVSKRVKAIASYLCSLEIKKEEKIAIISNSRADWMEADLGILAAGGVTISVYQSLPAADVAYILYDSGAQIVFVENQEQLDKLKYISENEVLVPEVEGRPAQKVRLNIKKIITFEETDSYANTVNLKAVISSAQILERLPYLELNRSNLASFVYTSGTTGPAKGVVQTHGNHLSNARQAYQSGIYKLNSSLMIVLPLAHSFAKLMGYIGFLTPAVIKFPAVADPKSSKLNANSVTRDINICEAEIFPLVPRMLEKMKEGIEKQAEGIGLVPKLLTFALNQVDGIIKCKKEGKKPGIGLSLKYALSTPLRKLIKKKLFGTQFKYIISGGAKLPIDIAYFFNALQIDALEGYGLTETCVATNVNRVGQLRIGTVGPVLAKCIEQKIAPDGEILFRGPNISVGYWNRPEATKAQWDAEGWFHTGDLGSIDSDGFLSITGRKKEIIVTSNGKKIAPDPIEGKLKTIKLVSQAVLFGEGKNYCVALLTLDPTRTLQAGRDELHRQVWKEVEELNKQLASFETIKKIHLLDEDFTIDNGLLTPTMKVKRNEVAKRYKDLIDNLYVGGKD